ncbi:SOS response-associated peptidase [Alistipes sp.]|uniref:SOS response-associated peptidase n=1 Tax=Alistipes sp. TaxID=1872444 RepID=UPI003AF8508F
MCYHIFLAAGPDELARHFGRKADLNRNFRPPCRVCAFSHLPYPILTRDEQIQYASWGLIPYWIRKTEDTVTLRNQTVNARAETIFENASFRVPIRQRRCLVPVSGFYGWRHEQNRKIPLYVTLKERPLFSLAGIFDCWYCSATAALTMTFSIITTEANPLMRYVDNANCRMPVILRPDDEERWLNPELSDRQIAALLKPYPEQELYSEPVRCDFMHEAAADPGIVVPA